VAEDLFDTQEKTEEPTGRRLEEARAQGRFARSEDLSHALVLLSVAGFLVFAGGGLAQALRGEIVDGVRRLATPPATFEEAVQLVRDTFLHLARIAGPCVLIAAVAAFALHFLQAGGFFVVRDAFRLRFDKFDVARNFARMFGLKSWVKLLAGVLKFAVVLGVVVWGVRARLPVFPQLSGMDFDRTVPAVVKLLLGLFVQVTGALVVIGGADWAFQRWQHHREMRMSKQQVRDESKHEDGDPAMKKKIRDRQRAIVERPLVQSVPEATVIVTNPTHYSVAIRYEEGKSAAPVVTAKGVDRVAEEIKRLAREHDVPILEQPPLARALFRDVPVGQMIPEKLYRAVAGVLAIVWRLRQKRETARATTAAQRAGAASRRARS
jgi:flagellar biosynthetic protein FlhB